MLQALIWADCKYNRIENIDFLRVLAFSVFWQGRKRRIDVRGWEGRQAVRIDFVRVFAGWHRLAAQA